MFPQITHTAQLFVHTLKGTYPHLYEQTSESVYLSSQSVINCSKEKLIQMELLI